MPGSDSHSNCPLPSLRDEEGDARCWDGEDSEGVERNGQVLFWM